MNKLLKVALLASAVISGSAFAAVNNPNAQLSDLQMTHQNNIATLSGIVTNTSGHELSHMFVKANLLKNGVVVGSFIDYAQDIKPGQSWKLKARTPDSENADAYEITSVETTP